ncbi:hypothetical protein FRC15_010575 [Serendipita sp. 397]|nr:hypothetical protein FRC15_010575 [Serendipita sp. 397]
MASQDTAHPQESNKLEYEELRAPNNNKDSVDDQDSCIICLQQIHDSVPSAFLRLGYTSSTITSDRPYTITSTANRERRANAAAYQRASQIRRDEVQRRDELHAMITRRKFIYQNVLYAKHVASNKYTRYAPHPTPAQVAVSIDLQRKAAAFLRRELQVWSNLDVEFLTNYIVMMIKVVDLRTEGGIKILSDLLDPGIRYTEEGRKPNTEHLAHELYSYLRSPFKSIESYDRAVQYGEAGSHLLRNLQQDSWRSEDPRELSPPPRSKPSQSSRKRSYEELGSMDSTGHGRRIKHKPSDDDRDKANDSRSSLLRSKTADVQPDIPENRNISQDALADVEDSAGRSTSSSRSLEHNIPGEEPVSLSGNPEQGQDSLLVRIRKEMVVRRREGSQGLPKSSDSIVPSSLNNPGITKEVLEDDSRPENILTNLKTIRRQQLPIDVQDKEDGLADLASISAPDLYPRDQPSMGFQIRGAAAKAKEKAMLEMENSLKAKASLQVRLARERTELEAKSSESIENKHLDVTLTNAKGTQATISVTPLEPNAPTESLLKERLLREKLMLNRRQTKSD